MEEIWKDVFGYEGLYEVSDLGRIKSVERYSRKNNKTVFYKSKIKKITISNNGNAVVTLTKDNIGKLVTVARLVYKAFNPEFDIDNSSFVILNKDGNKENNNIDNLYIKKRREMLGTWSVKKSVICITTNKEFKSAQEASEYYSHCKCGRSSITHCCKGKQKSCGMLEDGTKMVWMYLEEYKRLTKEEIKVKIYNANGINFYYRSE